MPEHYSALITAAGRSRRMGQFKPLLPLGGKTVIECTLERALTAAETAVVVTGHRGAEVEQVLRKRFPSRVLTLRNADFERTDMLRSVQLGAAALPPCSAFFLLPGDMPLISPDTFRALLEQRQKQPVPLLFPVYQGRRAHPPLIDSSLIPAILSYAGTDGLRGLWRRYPGREVPVNDPGSRLDLDTPEDYQRCMALSGQQSGTITRFPQGRRFKRRSNRYG